MFETTFGEVDKKVVKRQFDLLIGKVFKIIHLKEEECETIDKYIESLCRKFMGISKMYFPDESLSIIHILNGLNLDNHNSIRSDVFEVIKIIESIKERCDC